MPRLLVIDDSPTIRKLVEITFRPTGWAIDFAATGRDGIARAAQTPPNAILLDFVLPDMRGLEVAAQLSREPSTSRVPVLLMTAKDERVRELFRPYPSVVDFVHKPFGGDDLLARVRTAVADDEGRIPANGSSFTHAQKEAAAKALFARLKKPFAHIPSWCAQMGANAPAPFFARKILTSELVGELLDALVPTMREIVAAEARHDEARETAPAEDARLSGDLRGWPLADVLTLLGASGRTGELRLEGERATTLVYFRGGEIVLVTTLDPAAYLQTDGVDVIAAPPDARARADAAMRESGKPLHVSLAEQGALPATCDLCLALQTTGRRLLLDALDARAQRFVFRDLAALPPYVEAYGRHVSIARKTLMYPPPERAQETRHDSSLSSLALDHARHASHAAANDWPAPDAVLDRARGFSDKVKGRALETIERRLLALVDARWPLHGIAARAGLAVDDVRRVAWSLLEVGLLVRAADPASARPVLVLDPDVEGFQRPLESLLAQRAEPVPLVAVDRWTSLVDLALQKKPSLVLVNATDDDAEETARAFRNEKSLSDVALVAVLETTSEARAPELEAAGFDAVLVKPLAYADLEKLIRL